jgi:hypothetical protein
MPRLPHGTLGHSQKTPVLFTFNADLCRLPLAKSVSVGSQQLDLYVKWQPEGRDKFGEFGWPWELWPWPPSAGCSNTGQPATMWLDGKHSP